LVQFDSETDTIGYNSRIQWEVAPGSFLYVVLNQNLDRDDGNVKLLQSELTTKLGVTIRF